MSVPDNGPVIVGVTWWLCILCGAFLGLRIYAKISRHQCLWWDDWILIFSWIMLLIESILTQMGQFLGFGKRTVDIPVQNLATIALYTSIGASVSCFASTFSKISFAVTLLRLTEGPTLAYVWFCAVTLFVVMLPSALLTWVQCTPTEKAWNTDVEGSCWDASITVDYGIFNAAFCALVDFSLALLPWKLLLGMRMQLREKIGVGIAMSMGVLAGICAIVKGVYIVQLRQQDFYYNGKDVTIWTAVETATAIIGASIPVLRVFCKEQLLPSFSHGHNSNSHLSMNFKLSTFRSRSCCSRDETELSSSRRDKDGDWMSLKSSADDAASERSILRDDNMAVVQNGRGILQTNTVVVEYEEGTMTPRRTKTFDV